MLKSADRDQPGLKKFEPRPNSANHSTATEPPAGLTLALAGLWWDAKGDWNIIALANAPNSV
jgi:hypothetical protein